MYKHFFTVDDLSNKVVRITRFKQIMNIALKKKNAELLNIISIELSSEIKTENENIQLENE